MQESRQSKIQDDAKKRKEEKARQAVSAIGRRLTNESKIKWTKNFRSAAASGQGAASKKRSSSDCSGPGRSGCKVHNEKSKKSKRPRATEGAEASSEMKRRKRELQRRRWRDPRLHCGPEVQAVKETVQRDRVLRKRKDLRKAQEVKGDRSRFENKSKKRKLLQAKRCWT